MNLQDYPLRTRSISQRRREARNPPVLKRSDPYRRDSSPYLWVCVYPGHPQYHPQITTVPLHRALAAEREGRYLVTEEVVHHENENKIDNRLENLKLISPSEHTREHSLGRTATLATRKKMSLASKGKPKSLDHRAHIADALRGVPFSPERRANISKALSGRTLSEEHKAKIRAQLKPPTGEAHHCARLTVRSVLRIRRCYRVGVPIAELALELRLPHQTIMKAVRGKTWNHVPGAIPAPTKRRRDFVV